MSKIKEECIIIPINECFECGEETEAHHHVVPRVLGGTKTIPLCQKCHDIVHSDRPVRRTSVSELTKEGLRKARERGVQLGRPKDEEKRRIVRKLRNQGHTLRVIGEVLALREVREKAYTPQAVASLLKE